MKHPLGLLDRNVVNRSATPPIEPVLIILPFFIPVCTEPVIRIIVIFVCETNCDSISVDRPQLLNQAIVEFFFPFSLKKFDDFFSSARKFSSISPGTISAVSQCDFLRVTRIPTVFCHSNFDEGGFVSKRGKRRAS